VFPLLKPVHEEREEQNADNRAGYPGRSNGYLEILVRLMQRMRMTDGEVDNGIGLECHRERKEADKTHRRQIEFPVKD